MKRRRRPKVQPVVFRKWNKRHGGDIIAILPGGPVNYGMVMMYEHTGQHGEGDYWKVVGQSKPAKPSEYKELLRELHQVGYRNLRPARRLSHETLRRGWAVNPRRRSKIRRRRR